MTCAKICMFDVLLFGLLQRILRVTTVNFVSPAHMVMQQLLWGVNHVIVMVMAIPSRMYVIWRQESVSVQISLWDTTVACACQASWEILSK